MRQETWSDVKVEESRGMPDSAVGKSTNLSSDAAYLFHSSTCHR